MVSQTTEMERYRPFTRRAADGVPDAFYCRYDGVWLDSIFDLKEHLHRYHPEFSWGSASTGNLYHQYGYKLKEEA